MNAMVHCWLLNISCLFGFKLTCVSDDSVSKYGYGYNESYDILGIVVC